MKKFLSTVLSLMIFVMYSGVAYAAPGARKSAAKNTVQAVTIEQTDAQKAAAAKKAAEQKAAAVKQAKQMQAMAAATKAHLKPAANAKSIALAFVFDGPSHKNQPLLTKFQQTIKVQLLPDYIANFPKDLVFTGDWTE